MQVALARAYMAEQLVRALTSRSPQISPGRKADWLVFEELGWFEGHLVYKELDLPLKGVVGRKANEQDDIEGHLDCRGFSLAWVELGQPRREILFGAVCCKQMALLRVF